MNRHDDQSRVTGGQDTDPGALVYTGDTPARPVSVTVVNYDGSRLDEQIRARPEDFQSLILRPTVTWINVDGVHDTSVIQAIGDAVGIHPLTREDIATPTSARRSRITVIISTWRSVCSPLTAMAGSEVNR